MNMQEHHLILLMEECAEAAQRASKQLRFGRNEVQPGQDQPNHKRLRVELLDVLACIKFLETSGQIEPIDYHDVATHIQFKQKKIKRMLDLSRAQDCLQDSAGDGHG